MRNSTPRRCSSLVRISAQNLISLVGGFNRRMPGEFLAFLVKELFGSATSDGASKAVKFDNRTMDSVPP
jgi:hypothetical protein